MQFIISSKGNKLTSATQQFGKLRKCVLGKSPDAEAHILYNLKTGRINLCYKNYT